MTAGASLAPRLLRFARRQTRAEVARQFAVVARLERDRRLLSVIAFASSFFFLPAWLCALLFVIDTLAELLGFSLLRDLDPPARPLRYYAMLGSYLLSQVIYCLVPALCWQIDAPMAKAYAVGMTLVSLIHIATVRTVHLPLGLVGGATVTVVSALANLWFWLGTNPQAGQLTGLGITTVCIAATAYLALITMLSVHALYDEMIRDRAAAEAADQAKSRFLAQMSHELRTPLNAILGMGSAELTAAATEEGRERLSILVQSARGLSVMLDDILDLSAVQAGELPIRPRALPLRAEITGTVAMFRQQIEDQGLVLRLAMHDSTPMHARLDGQRLRQCLSNILSNAVKHTREGLISVYAYELSPGMLAIKVADSGPGVPQDLREKIFEPFYRASTSVPGTGLGMSIARTLARRMGGDLVLLPSVTGAHFLLTLAIAPADAAEVAVVEPVAGQPATGAAPPRTLTGLKVLVVDDIGTNRLVASTYLRLLGAVPDEAQGGAEALARLTGPNPPDVVLLDLLMPEMDGLETLARIRGLPGPSASTPVVAMSADAAAGLDAGFDAQINKPLSAEALSAVLTPLAGRKGKSSKA